MIKTIKESCEICNEEINVSETALKLCDTCFEEKCKNKDCGHRRAIHVGNVGNCVHEYNLNHKTKRGEFCSCKKFEEKK